MLHKYNWRNKMKIIITFSHLTTLLILLGVFYIPSAYAACGGVNEQACCLSEQSPTRPACDAELVQTALGQYPNACGVFGASTCLPKTPVTACGGEGQRSCCAGEGPVCRVRFVMAYLSITPMPCSSTNMRPLVVMPVAEA